MPCPQCRAPLPADALQCPNCGFIPPPRPNPSGMRPADRVASAVASGPQGWPAPPTAPGGQYVDPSVTHDMPVVGPSSSSPQMDNPQSQQQPMWQQGPAWSPHVDPQQQGSLQPMPAAPSEPGGIAVATAEEVAGQQAPGANPPGTVGVIPNDMTGVSMPGMAAHGWPPESMARPSAFVVASIKSRVLAQLIDSLCMIIPLYGIYYLWTVLTRGDTLGKRVMGLRIIAYDGQSKPQWTQVLIRELIKYVLLAVPVVGWIVLAITTIGKPRNRGLHDKAGSTEVVDIVASGLPKEPAFVNPSAPLAWPAASTYGPSYAPGQSYSASQTYGWAPSPTAGTASPTPTFAEGPAPTADLPFANVPLPLAEQPMAAEYAVNAPQPAAPPLAVQQPMTAAPAGPSDAASSAEQPEAAMTISTVHAVFDSGEQWEITTTGVIFGRAPLPQNGLPGAELITVDDPGRSMSKSHLALYRMPEGEVVVVDLNSMNGVVILGLDGSRWQAEPATATLVPYGATLMVGDRTVRIG